MNQAVEITPPIGGGSDKGLSEDLREIQASRLDAVQLDSLIQAARISSDGGGIIKPVEVASDVPGMGLPDLAVNFSQGLQNGFVVPHLEHFIKQSTLANQAGSEISSGELLAEALKLSLKLGVSDAFRSVSSKLSEGINNIVVKQG